MGGLCRCVNYECFGCVWYRYTTQLANITRHARYMNDKLGVPAWNHNASAPYRWSINQVGCRWW